MGKYELKVVGGKLVRAETLVDANKYIKKIKITGDFFLHPEELIEEIESALIGVKASNDDVKETIYKILNEKNGVLIGITVEDLTKTIINASSV
ncbi:MAG: lipoate protein ligase C-terminal domain-containing protein [Candidatus Odinarchaeia archaeon]